MILSTARFQVACRKGTNALGTVALTELFEPPKNGHWHQAHNTALFLQLVSIQVHYLIEQDGKPIDLERFRKNIRALTAKLNVQYKVKNNARKKDNDLKMLVRREVRRLLGTPLKEYLIPEVKR